MFVLALVAIVILGVVVIGLLWLLSKSISNQRNQSRQEPETTPTEVNPKPDGDEQLAALIRKIDEYHDKDTRRSLANRFEHLTYVLWGFVAALVGLALAVISMPDTNWGVVTFDIIVACIFGGLAIGAHKKLAQYRRVDWRDFWGDKNY